MNDRLKKQIDFIIEIDKMKSVFRKNIIIDRTRNENDAEHSWHISAIAMLLYEYAYQPGIDLLHVLKLLLIHDIIEVYAGDTFAYDEKANMDKEEREKKAADKIFGMLPDDQQKEYRALWEEFDAMETPESIYAAACDRFEPFILNCNTDGHTWRLADITKDRVYKRLYQIKLAMPEIWEVVENLIEENIQKGYIRP